MVSNKDEKLIRQSTSFYEQAIFYYVRKFFPDALNRYQIECAGNKVEIDIFVPSIKVGIEYDGGYWHQDKFIHDDWKNRVLNGEGIYLIRVNRFLA